MKTDAFGAYKIYLALKLHFAGSYDAVKYNFKTNAGNYEKFRNRPEAYWFNKLSDRLTVQELTDAFVANFVAGEKYGGMHSPKFQPNYDEWKKRVEGLSYTFSNDLETARNMLEDALIPLTLADLFLDGECMPPVVRLYQRKRISLETVVILDKLTGFTLKCDHVKDTILWPNAKRLIQKYGSFLQFDKPKFKEILLAQFSIGVPSNVQDMDQE